MVKLLHTVVARSAVLRSGWLIYLAGVTERIFRVHHLVILISLPNLFRMLLVPYNSWVDSTGLVKAIVTNEHCYRPCVIVIFRHVGAGDVFHHAHFYVDYEASTSHYKIKYLDHRVWLIYPVINELYNFVN